MTLHDKRRTDLLAAIDGLYSAFAHYRLTDVEQLSCYDCGPDEAELAAVRDHALPDIPKHALKGMEFYSHGWQSWGTENEVKHFLPRLLELIAQDPEMLEGAGLFKYKLCGSLRPTRRAPFPGVRWPDAEGQALLAWADAVIAFHLHGTVSVLGLIEAVLEMGMRSDEIVRAWSEVSDELRRAQIDADWQPTFSNDEDVCAEAAKLAEWMGAQGQM